MFTLRKLCISQPDVGEIRDSWDMKQISLASTGFELMTKRTRKRECLDEMNLVVPWTELVGLIKPHAPAGKTGRPPFAALTMLHIHFLLQWRGLSDPAMEEALHDVHSSVTPRSDTMDWPRTQRNSSHCLR